jgi:hypothetical protein
VRKGGEDLDLFIGNLSAVFVAKLDLFWPGQIMHMPTKKDFHRNSLTA